MDPSLGEDVFGFFKQLNQQAARAVRLLYLGNNKVFSESLLEQVRSCSSKIERVLAMSNDPQILENDTPTKCSIMVSIAVGMSVYQPDGIVNDGRGRAAFTHIILLAKDEEPTKSLAYQAAMINNWVRFPWNVLCEKCPVILSLLDDSLLPRTDSEKPLVFARKLDGYDKVKDLNDWEAFRAVKSIGFRLKGAKNCEQLVKPAEKTEMVHMGRFLGVTESSLRDICSDLSNDDMASLFGLDTQMPQKVFEKNDNFSSFDISSLNKKIKLNEYPDN